MPLPRLRVIYLDHCARLSGAEIALARLLPHLRTRVDPLVLLGEDGPLVGRLQDLGVPVEVVPLDARVRELRKDTVATSSFNLRSAATVLPYTLRLARRLRDEQPDLVHTNSMKAALYGGAAARLSRVPMVWHLRDRVAPDYLPGPAVHLVRMASRLLPAAVVANSANTLSTVPAGSKGHVVHNVMVQQHHATAAGTASNRGLVIGVVGRLAPWKGQHVFLEAFAQAFRGTDVRARLVGSALFGEGDYELRLHELARSLGIDDQVEFRGFREDVEAELAQLDVLVHCSTSPEPFGQVVVEGMLAGLPVVAAAEGGPAEVVQDGVDGVLVEPRRPELLADVLRALVGDAGLRARLGAAGRASAQRFSPERAAAGMLAVYDSVTHRDRRYTRRNAL